MVQNVVFVAGDAVEQPFVGGAAQFFKRAEIRRGEVAARTATNGRLQAAPAIQISSAIKEFFRILDMECEPTLGIPFSSVPSYSLHSLPSRVISPNGVWGGAPAEIKFGTF